MTPVPTPDQAVHVLEILGEWTRRGFRYSCPGQGPGQKAVVFYTNPDYEGIDSLGAEGVNHLDALCQATTVMQMLLEEHPEARGDR